MPRKEDFIKSVNFTPKKHTPYLMQKNEVDKQLEKKDVVYKEVDPTLIKNWVLHDRPESELGDIKELAKDLIKIGQQQPCVVRPIVNDDYKYELIIGERRWLASKQANIKLKVLVNKNMSDSEAALAQATENDNRVGLSDYAKGISYSKLIKNKIIKQKDLIESLGKSHQYISALLSFSKIPSIIHDSVGDWKNVSARTSETIVRLSKKSDKNIDVIISLSDKIRNGSIGWSTISKLVMKKVHEEKVNLKNKKIATSDGRHLFTWRTDNNSLPSIHFPKNVSDLFITKKIDIEKITKEFTKILKENIDDI
jgi:ParB family transcriptional regulator, chromosome partitioning protein